MALAPLGSKDNIQRWTSRLGEELAKLPSCPSEAHDAYVGLTQSAKEWQPECSGAVQKTMRDELWNLRRNLSAEGQPEAPEAIREIYEKLRNLSLNDSLKQALGVMPSATWVNPDPADIPNFRAESANYLRGGQPNQAGMEYLSHVAKSEVDLRDDADRHNQWAPPHDYPLQVFPIGIPDNGHPCFEDVEKFIEFVDNPANQPVYVHCKAGIGRTGLMTACWHVSHGMSAEDAISHENIKSSYGTLKQEQFVRDFETYWKAKMAS